MKPLTKLPLLWVSPGTFSKSKILRTWVNKQAWQNDLPSAEVPGQSQNHNPETQANCNINLKELDKEEEFKNKMTLEKIQKHQTTARGIRKKENVEGYCF